MLALNANAGVTFVIDFKLAGSPQTTAITGDKVGAADYGAYGFGAGQIPTLINSIMAELSRDYHQIPTNGVDARSPIPDGKELDVDFVAGSIGSAPSNGASEYYYVQVGDAISGPNVGGGTLGVARQNSARTSAGADGNANIGDIVGSIFVDAIQTIGGLPAGALSTGNLAFSTFAIEGTLAHEIGHTLSLSHVNKAGSITPTGTAPLMGTGAVDLPNIDRISDREFSYSGFDSQQFNSPAVFHVQQLVRALGLRDVRGNTLATPEPSTFVIASMGIGFAIVAGRRRRAA